MKPRFFLIILITFIVLGGLALLLSPQPLTPEEAKRANKNRNEISRGEIQKNFPDSIVTDSLLDLQNLE